MAEYRGALPQPTPESQPYWDGLKEHKLLLPYCVDCEYFFFYPRPFCPDPDCFSWNVDWREASGKGVVHTYVISHQPIPPMQESVPYVIAVIELEEGPRLMSNLIIDDPYGGKDLREHGANWVEAAVEIVYDDVTDDVTLPKFKLV